MGLFQSCSQRTVERVDRTVSFAGSDDPLATAVQLDRCLADHRAVSALLDDDPPRFEREVPMTAFELLTQQQFERGFGGLEDVPMSFEFLDPVDHPAERGSVTGQVEAHLATLELDR